jgi:hypothetical protein
MFQDKYNFIQGQRTNIQLTIPHNHQINAAEVFINTAKYHFIAALYMVLPDYLLQPLCSFLPQVETTLNLFHASC